MSSLTKDQLRNELINHGVDLPQSSSKKEEYLKLYNRHVLPAQNAAGEFSSDEEVIEESNGLGNGCDTDLSSVAMLTDEQIRDRLSSYGLVVGPVVATTRHIMEKKLASLMHSGAPTQQPTLSEASTADSATNGHHVDEDSDVLDTAKPIASNGNLDVDEGTRHASVSNGNADERFSCDSSEDEEIGQPVMLSSTAADTAADTVAVPAGDGSDRHTRVTSVSRVEQHSVVRHRASISNTKASASPLTGGDAVRAVYLRGNRDTPSPRRPISEMRGIFNPSSVNTSTVTSSPSLFTHRTSVSQNKKPATVRRQGSRPLSMLGFLFLVLVIVSVGCFVAYHYYSRQGGYIADTFKSVEKAAVEALKKFRRVNTADPPRGNHL